MAGLGQSQKPPRPPRYSSNFGATVFILLPGGGMEFCWRSDLSHAPVGRPWGAEATESLGSVAESRRDSCPWCRRGQSQPRRGTLEPERPQNPSPGSQECDSVRTARSQSRQWGGWADPQGSSRW